MTALALPPAADLALAAEGLREAFEAALAEWVQIPSVSPDPAFAPQVRAAGEWAGAFLAKHGYEVELIETPGQPIVVAERKHPKATRTLTIYNHYDVQPAGEPEWRTEPFTFVKEGDTYRGRGTTDDKGPALAAFYAAELVKALDLPINLRFLWEGEEEIGSPNFRAALAANQERLATDLVVVSDTIWVARDKPASPTGLRGMMSFRMLLETGTKDVHSGLTGGAARNPIAELCDLIVAMHDAKSGAIKIPGVMDPVVPPTAEEVQGFLDSGFSAERFQEAHGLKCLRTQDPAELTQRIWARPTFEVHGIVGGYQGPGVKAIVPPRAEAKCSMRLVPDQKPEAIAEAVKAFIAQHNPDVEFVLGGALEPYQAPVGGDHLQLVKDAVRFAFGQEPAFVREGGSIGAIVPMRDLFNAPVAFVGLSLPEHGYHAPNECFDWGMAKGGMLAFAHLLGAFAKG